MIDHERVISWGKGIILGMFFIVALWGCATPEVEHIESSAIEEREAASDSAQISQISTESLVGKMRITLEADSELTYTAFKLTDPLRLVLDLPDVDASEVSEITFGEASPVKRITPFQFTDGGTTNSRIEIALTRLVPYQVFSDANKLYIDLETPVEEMAMTPASTTTSTLPPGFEELKPLQTTPPTVIESRPGISPLKTPEPIKIPEPTITELPSLSQPQPLPQHQETLPMQPDIPTIEIQQPPQDVGGVTPLPGMSTDLSLIQDLQVTESDGKTRITVYTNTLPEFEVKRSETPPRLTLDLKQSELPPGNEEVISPDELETVVKQVRMFQLRKTPDGTDNRVRLLVDLMKPTKHEVSVESGRLTIEFDHQKIFTSTELASEQEEIVEVPLTTGLEQALDEEMGPTEEAQFAAEPTIRSPRTDEEQEYKGQVISIHFQEADILDVLQVIAEVSGLNLVVHPGVSGTVTVHLNNIPWDQALDIVLKMNNLSVEIEGNILRVAQSNIFQQEIAQRVEQQRQQIEARRVQEELEPLETKLITINFAEPQSIVNIINQYFQGTFGQAGIQQEERRGTITVDERTKTLIIQDTTQNIRKIEEIVATLDRRTPQVMIEARVVSISSFFQKELGISWGGSFAADPQHGNPLDYRFPYTINTDGFGVNLPGVTNPVFSTGDIRFGSIDDVFTIFAKIDAAERENKTKTLGQPKIFTQDNVPANVSAGQVRRITETTTTAGTTTTQTTEVEATLSLNVTPRVSNDGYITMTVTVSNDAFTGATGTDTSTQTVNSEITVKDGETVVIGGIYQTTESENTTAVPYLHKIPLIGRLFKSTLPNTNEKTELLIFLTPRILDRQFLQPDQEGTNVSLAY